ncbi:MAG: hypothetical protein Q9212_002430 [Teloschistes hypoglaucus]
MSLAGSSTGSPARQPVEPPFLSLFKIYPVFKELCVHLSISEIIRLSRTCKALSHLYPTLLGFRHYWNFDRDLLRFVKDPRGLRGQLAKCDGFISGSFVLQFFERVCWEESDLDIFVEEGAGAEDTLVMNILTWDKAYALFPNSTFFTRKGVVLKKRDDVLQRFADKYEGRDYRLTEMERYDKRRNTAEIAEIRRPGDRLTWSIPFDTAGIGPPKTPTFVLEHSAFGFERRASPPRECCTYAIIASPFESCVLRYQFTRPRHVDSNDAATFFAKMQAKLDDLTVQELGRLPVDLRPPSDTLMRQERADLGRFREELFDNDIPRLSCHDDQIPQWYADWERMVHPSGRICMAPPDAEKDEEVLGIE